MMRRIYRILFLTPLAVFLAVGAQVAAGADSQHNYTFRTVDLPASFDCSFDQITWINNWGLITKQYLDYDNNMHAAVLWNRVWTIIDVPVPGAVASAPSAPNEQGQVAMSYFGADGITHLAIWQRGRFNFIPDLPGIISQGAQAINERGQLSGGCALDSAPDIGLGFVGDNRYHKIFAYPGSDVVWTFAFATNDSGITVGAYGLSDNSWHAFLYDGKRFTNIDAPGALPSALYFSAATSINNEGEIIGSYTNSGGMVVGFTLYHGKYTDFVYPGAILTAPYTITGNGQISGNYQAKDGSYHGFVATPAGGK